ncbi:hypothetical protein DSCW_13690 [Desulfosarcina widdelii]|uniref:L,D-TPase catalytic domain-containing protein n=1 Tax=Desulfosarcina widdelii TaxID=947919 RepID=A0A5K7YW25_9BACT|nr:L,D-transpeptidase family protein [Desulfosarcina widdelii]BBO73952.1 hypothetical protein DSCW_13690 [Desulfosarcina widdelii]
MKSIVILCLLLLLCPPFGLAIQKADRVLVVKSEKKLYLENNGKVIRSYPVALGGNPKGHKQRQGDRRTPEGRYILDLKNPNSAYYKSIRISYPNAADRMRARREGVHPGGWIMIHGQKNGYGHLAPITQRYDWTTGCIAVTNAEMDEIWQAVDIGTPIEIRP